MVTFKTMCWNGRILALRDSKSNMSVCERNSSLKKELSDDMGEHESLCKSRLEDDDVESLCSDFMDLDTDDEDGGRAIIDLTHEGDTHAGSEAEEGPKENDKVKVKIESKQSGSLDVNIPDYASEEWVRTLPKLPVLCTNVDIDRCVGKLLITEHNRRKKVGILDRESILDLQAKSCALEEFYSVSNEVEVGSESGDEAGSGCSDMECCIPLSNSNVDKVRKIDMPKLSGHMLSFQASSIVSTTSEAHSPR